MHMHEHFPHHGKSFVANFMRNLNFRLALISLSREKAGTHKYIPVGRFQQHPPVAAIPLISAVFSFTCRNVDFFASSFCNLKHSIIYCKIANQVELEWVVILIEGEKNKRYESEIFYAYGLHRQWMNHQFNLFRYTCTSSG